MKDRVKTELHIDPSKIYTEEQERLFRVDKVPRSQVGLYIRKYQSYKSTFLKLRHGLKPQLPQTLFDLNFEGDNFKYSQTTDEEPFLRHHSKNEDNHLLMFASNEGLKLLSTSSRWHSDGTFFAAPKPFNQVYIIHAYTDNGHMLPCAYYLTQKKDCAIYKAMFTHLKNAAEENGYILNPKTIVVDFELAAINAYKFHWPGAEIKGCFFHFTQAVLRWAFRNGYKLHYSANTTFKLWLKMILALPVVPVGRIFEAWEIIKTKAPTNLNVQPIIDYFNDTLLNG